VTVATSDRVDASLEWPLHTWPLHAGVLLWRCTCQTSGTVSCASNDSAADVSFARSSPTDAVPQYGHLIAFWPRPFHLRSFRHCDVSTVNSTARHGFRTVPPTVTFGNALFLCHPRSAAHQTSWSFISIIRSRRAIHPLYRGEAICAEASPDLMPGGAYPPPPQKNPGIRWIIYIIHETAARAGTPIGS